MAAGGSAAAGAGALLRQAAAHRRPRRPHAGVWCHFGCVCMRMWLYVCVCVRVHRRYWEGRCCPAAPCRCSLLKWTECLQYTAAPRLPTFLNSPAHLPSLPFPPSPCPSCPTTCLHPPTPTPHPHARQLVELSVESANEALQLGGSGAAALPRGLTKLFCVDSHLAEIPGARGCGGVWLGCS